MVFTSSSFISFVWVNQTLSSEMIDGRRYSTMSTLLVYLWLSRRLIWSDRILQPRQCDINLGSEKIIFSFVVVNRNLLNVQIYWISAHMSVVWFAGNEPSTPIYRNFCVLWTTEKSCTY